MKDRVIKAVIFDMDGVLIDARDWHYEALNSALKAFGLEISRHDHLTTYDGLSTYKKLEILSSHHYLPNSLHSLLNDLKQAYTLDLINQLCRPTFIHQFALSRLRHDGYKLAVASNSIRNSVEIMLRKANLAQYLEFYLSNQDVDRPKPYPDLYNLAISRLGLTPTECVIVEDNENGLKAARESGAHVLQVSSPDDVTYQSISTFIGGI